ncbi:MAG: MFS transporter, partial [Alphaproteobacteria bacterium]|nr:MFS transporter [Alphaproteobacteria bacterium]
AFGLFATLLGLAIGGALLNAAGMVRSLWVCGILQLGTNFIFIGLAVIGTEIWMLAITIGFENMAAGMGTAVFVAYLSSLCNVSFTATQYALLSAFAAFGRTLLSTLSGPMVDYLGWIPFFTLSAVAAVPGLILLFFMAKYFAPPEFSTGTRA